MSYKNQVKNLVTILLIFCIQMFDCYPIEVTGKNITYYKLTPNEGSGSYNFDYGTHDGSKRSERGFIKHEPGSDKPLLVVTGSFKYPDANEVFYIADEQGYRLVSKEEIDDLHNKLPNEILPTPKPLSSKPLSVSSTVRPSLSSQSSATKSPSISVTRSPKTYSSSSVSSPENNLNPEEASRPVVHIPVTESQVIKVNIIQPVNEKAVTCPPGKCSGRRQSKIIKIKPLKFG